MFQIPKNMAFLICLSLFLIVPAVHAQDSFETAVEIPVNKAIVWGLDLDSNGILNGTPGENDRGTDIPVSIEELISQEENNTIFIDSVQGGVNSYIDRFIPTNGVDYYYWLQAEASSGASEKVAANSIIIITHVESTPSTFRIHPPYPNPFNPSTAVRYEIPFKCHVRLVVFDILGRGIAVLRNGIVSAGIHDVVWNGTDNNGMNVSSGVYLYRFEAEHEVAGLGKLMFLR